MPSDSQLLQRQDALQHEAHVLIEELRLIEVLSQAGGAKVHGSSVMGLMTWRDIDISVASPSLSIDHTYNIMLPLLTHPKIKKVRFSNEHGRFNTSNMALDDRYYFMLLVESGAETDWKIDISFWLDDSVRPEPFHELLEQKLTPETRLSILRIKDVWWEQPSYRQDVASVDIYDAVLLHGVHTLEDFDRYLSERGKPIRV